MQLFCMVTCGTPLIWICNEPDWQDIAGLLHASNRNLEDPELRAIISQYGDPERSPRSRDVSLGHENPDWLNLPTPREPLRAWTEIEPGVMIAVMETVMQLVKSQPDFEARRLARKSAVKFRY